MIITTYNWKEALELTLLSALAQSEPPDEILVADDGSTAETSQLVSNFAETAPLPIYHIWQDDLGFRAAKIRNKAIAQARGEYLIIVDGDMILHSRFVEDHKQLARSGFFSQGSRVLLTPSRTASVLAEKKIVFSFFTTGLKNRKNALRSPRLSALFSSRRRNLKGIRTCNFSLWKKDLIRINGFNEDFVGWGREDSELAVRLMNSGMLRQNLRFSALAYHLYHSSQPKERLAINDHLLEQAIKARTIRCENGIDKYLH